MDIGILAVLTGIYELAEKTGLLEHIKNYGEDALMLCIQSSFKILFLMDWVRNFSRMMRPRNLTKL